MGQIYSQLIASQKIYETIKGLSYNEYVNFEDIIETEEFIALIGFVIAGILMPLMHSLLLESLIIKGKC